MADHLSATAKASEAQGPPPTYAESQGQGQSSGSRRFGPFDFTLNTFTENMSQLGPGMGAMAGVACVPPSSGPIIHSQPHSHVVNMQNVQVQQPVFVTARSSVYGPSPVEMDCPHCQSHIVTHIGRVAGALPWIIFTVLAVLGFFLLLIPWCFCCLPFCITQCLDVVHSCPVCKRHLGRYNRM